MAPRNAHVYSGQRMNSKTLFSIRILSGTRAIKSRFKNAQCGSRVKQLIYPQTTSSWWAPDILKGVHSFVCIQFYGTRKQEL